MSVQAFEIKLPKGSSDSSEKINYIKMWINTIITYTPVTIWLVEEDSSTEYNVILHFGGDSYSQIIFSNEAVTMTVGYIDANTYIPLTSMSPFSFSNPSYYDYYGIVQIINSGDIWAAFLQCSDNDRGIILRSAKLISNYDNHIEYTVREPVVNADRDSFLGVLSSFPEQDYFIKNGVLYAVNTLSINKFGLICIPQNKIMLFPQMIYCTAAGINIGVPTIGSQITYQMHHNVNDQYLRFGTEFYINNVKYVSLGTRQFGTGSYKWNNIAIRSI